MGLTGEQKGITVKQVEHVARLARIELSEEEKRLFTTQFNAILDYFKILDEAETEEVQPLLNVLGMSNIWRRDETRPSLPVEEALSNAPRKERGYIKAPRIT
jgi:aspartyl-tRNA(Asn)/glutamyl-tRNA(Gln) amidotransferase subunit C